MLNELNSDKAKLVLQYIKYNNSANVDDIRNDLGLSCLSVYPVLEILVEEKEFVRKDGMLYKVNN